MKLIIYQAADTDRGINRKITKWQNLHAWHGRELSERGVRSSCLTAVAFVPNHSCFPALHFISFSYSPALCCWLHVRTLLPKLHWLLFWALLVPELDTLIFTPVSRRDVWSSGGGIIWAQRRTWASQVWNHLGRRDVERRERGASCRSTLVGWGWAWAVSLQDSAGTGRGNQGERRGLTSGSGWGRQITILSSRSHVPAWNPFSLGTSQGHLKEVFSLARLSAALCPLRKTPTF